MVSENENFRLGVLRKVEGALEVIANSGAEPPLDTGELDDLSRKLGLDLSRGEREMVLDAINETTNSPYAVPPKGVKDRYPHFASRWRLFRLGASHRNAPSLA